jgi:tetratricopeptide (TPR) repeat protein
VDGILVDETTYRATVRAIEYRAAEPVDAKGKSEPIPAWQALEARSRLGLDVGERTGTPLVGRELELELLTSAFERARTERMPQLVTLVGVPGIGKSRLALELFRRLDADPELVRWRQGRCLPYGEGVTLWALAEIVKAQAGVLETDPTDEAAAKLAAAVRDVVGDESEAAWVERHLRPLAGLGGVELRGDRRDEAFAAWRRFFEGVAERGPLVLALEDLQWADETLLEFVDHLVDWAADVPLLVLATARPEFLATRPDWGGGKANAATHSLAPLDEEETARLVHALLGRTVLPAETQRSLLDNAGGNPLYAEEFARMLAERGGAETPKLPESVQGIIAARLDGLDASDKALLQDAAVIGKVFWIGALQALAGEERWQLERRLHELERRELVRRDRQSTVGGERQYAFRHLLVREVAYGQIPRGSRSDKHAAAARWIEALSSDRSDDRADMLAHHWLAAVRYAEAAGRDPTGLADRAYAAVVDAADRALSLNATAAAISFYEQALALRREGEEPEPEVLLHYGRSLYVAADPRAAQVLASARDRLAEAGDGEGEALAESALGHLAWMTGDTEASRERLERSVRLVEGLGPSPVKARVLAFAAGLEMVAGRHAEALPIATAALELAEGLGLDDLRTHALTTIGSSRVHLDDERGLEDLERAIEIGRSARSPEAARASHNLGVGLFLLGDLRRFRELNGMARSYAEDFGGGQIGRFLSGTAPGIAYFTGEWADAERLAFAFLSESAKSPHYQEPNVRIVRSAIRFARDEGDVRDELERSLALLEPIRDPQARDVPLSLAARLFLESGDPERARTVAEAALENADSRETPVALVTIGIVARALKLESRLAAVLPAPGDHDSPWMHAARALLEERFVDAAEIFERMPLPVEAAGARLRASRALLADGCRIEADEQLQRSLAFWRSVGATRYVREAETLLAATA